ncbi:MAG: hypothetical protein ACLP9L_35235 [Thermoguttaceae bacterium]
MFPLYDHTRRQICMAAFLALCVLPTLAVTSWSVARHLPWHKQAEEQRLSQELGLDVSIESMRHVEPGVVRYTGLKLTDPETGLKLFGCLELSATWTSMTDSQGQTRPAIVLAATQAESAASDWERLNEVLRRRLECQGGRPEIELRLTADQWALHNGNETQVLLAVKGGIGLMPSGIQARLDFQLPGVNSPEPVQMGIVRNRQVSPPADGFEMHTGPSPVPCRLLATYVTEASALGPNCRFSGDVSTYSTPDGWSGDVSGQLTGVDLGRLARENSAAAIMGTADIALKKVKFQRGRIDELAGRIVCGPGALGRDMLAALVTHLRLTPAPQMSFTGQSLAFDRIGLDFWIDSRGISIAGQCAGVPGAVAVVGDRAILTEPASQPQPVAALIQALVPANEVPIPATRQTGRLARLLPMPDAAKAN